jgi:hypothetical protein
MIAILLLKRNKNIICFTFRHFKRTFSFQLWNEVSETHFSIISVGIESCWSRMIVHSLYRASVLFGHDPAFS